MPALCFTLLAILLPLTTVGAQGAGINAGIVQGLWYADRPVFAGEQTRIYVAVRNNTGNDLSGRVEFLVDEERVGAMNVNALDGRIIEAWSDWTPEYGEQTVSARLLRTEIRDIEGGSERVTVTSSLAKDTLFIDYDTDGDGIGNREDEDDDNDGRSDEQEILDGTDPLVPDEPADETSDESSANSATDEAVASSTHSNTHVNDDTQGIERYLQDSYARSVLESVTQASQAAQRSVDKYRTRRTADTAATATDETASSSTAIATPSTTTSSTGETATITRSVPNGPAQTWWRTQLRTIGEVLDSLYNMILLLTSTYLGNPALVQLTLMLLLLFGAYRLARHFGKRPGD